MDATQLVQQAFVQASRALRPSALRGAAPDWLDRSAIRAVWLSLRQDDSPRLHLGLRPGWSAAAFPRHWALDGGRERLSLRCVPTAAPLAQGLPTLTPERRVGFVGSATALLRDRLGSRRYLLTCGHVAAPNAQAQVGDLVRISGVAGTAGRSALLQAWQPVLAEGAYQTPIDAALLTLDNELHAALAAQRDLLPAGVGLENVRASQPLSLRHRSGSTACTALVFWSGDVDIPGLTPGEADYFLERAIGYRCLAGTQGGDSGAAVWDAEDRLRGMHLAGLVDAGGGADEPNALFGSIKPVLDWFSVSPVLRDGTAAPAESARATPTRDTTPAASALALREREVVAATLWGEARNQGREGLRAVACVIANRARTRYRRCADARAVCLDRWQFSCWNEGDPNRARMLAVVRRPDVEFGVALELADELLAGRLEDITHGARHYHTSRIKPFWARGKMPCAALGNHLFYNDVA